MLLKRKIVICLDKVNTTDASHHKVEEKSPDEVLHCPLNVIKAPTASSINRNVSLSLFCFVLCITFYGYHNDEGCSLWLLLLLLS